jgi:hypothetical protein
VATVGRPMLWAVPAWRRLTAAARQLSSAHDRAQSKTRLDDAHAAVFDQHLPPWTNTAARGASGSSSGTGNSGNGVQRQGQPKALGA